MTVSEGVDCLYCLDEGTVKRRYGTVGPGPARIVKVKECPMCGGASERTEGSQ